MENVFALLNFLEYGAYNKDIHPYTIQDMQYSKPTSSRLLYIST